jgi:ribonuclease P protein component
MTLPKHNRLKGVREFTKLFSTTRPVISPHFSLRAAKDDAARRFRVSVLISSKVAASATTRNTLRRKISAQLALITHGSPIADGVRAALSLRTSDIPEHEELRRELMALMKKSGILNQ